MLFLYIYLTFRNNYKLTCVTSLISTAVEGCCLVGFLLKKSQNKKLDNRQKKKNYNQEMKKVLTVRVKTKLFTVR